MLFVGIERYGLDIDTATGNLYFTSGPKLKRFTRNNHTQRVIFSAPAYIYAIAVDQLNRYFPRIITFLFLCHM